MKKFIVPMMLGLLTVGALTSCNSISTENVNRNMPIQNVKRSADTTKSAIRTVTSIGEYDLDNITITSAKELGLSIKAVSIPSYETNFTGKTSFEYMGFAYTASNASSSATVTRTGYATDASSVTEVFAGTISSAGGTTNTFTEYSDFVNATTLYGGTELGANIYDMTKLNTIVCGTDITFTEKLGSNVKFVVLSSDTQTLEGIKYLDTNTKIVCPMSIAPNIRKQLNEAYYDERDSFISVPMLYVVPDSDVPYQESRSPIYEIGGAFISKAQSTKYMISMFGDRLTKAVIDLSLLDGKLDSVFAASPLMDIEKYDFEEVYCTFLNYDATAAFRYISADKMYLGNTSSTFWGNYYTGFDEIYMPETDTGFTTITLNNSNYENNTFYFPESEKESGDYENLITALEGTSATIEYYDPSTYEPVMEVEVNGIRKSTKDMTVSYSELVAEAAAEYEESLPKDEANNPSDKDEELTPEEQEKLEEDKETAAPVTDSITSLGEITLDSKDAILEAKEAFEALTYDQQQLVENVEELQDAIKAYNELVEEHNKDIEDEDDKLELIEELHVKNKVEGFIEDIKEDKAMTAVTVLAGTALGGLLLYGIYKLISKFVRWVKR